MSVNEEALNKALNHHCFKCPNLKTQDFKRCYCDILKKRILFKDDDPLDCPLLYIAYFEINAPRYPNDIHVKKKNDEHIYRIENSYFNMDIREYEYSCWILTRPKCYESSVQIKHSDIEQIIPNDDERVIGKKRIVYKSL